MNLRGLLEVLGANAVLISLLYWVTLDEAARSAYAAHEGLAFQVFQSVLYQTSTLWGSSGPLQSPPTLDWVQLLVIAILAVDALVVYGALARRRRARAAAP